MCFTIRQDSILDGIYELVYRLPFTSRNLVKGRTMIVYFERVGQVVFGNMADMGDHVNGHPGANSLYISCFDRAILLLETSHRLKGIYPSKG